MVMANCLYSAPVMPPRNATGMNTAFSTSTTAITGPRTSSIARLAASFGDRPNCTMLRSVFSTTTIASSTTRPIARIMPNSVSMLIEKPNTSMPTSATEDRDRHRERRDDREAQAVQEDEHHQHDQHDRLEERLHHLVDRRLHEQGGVERDLVLRGRRESSSTARPASRGRSSTPRSRWRPAAGRPRSASPACPGSGAQRIALRAEVGVADVLDPHQRGVRVLARRIMLSNCAGSVMVLVVTGNVCFTGYGVGGAPIRPTANCWFWFLIALAISVVEMPSCAIRSGLSQMRIAYSGTPKIDAWLAPGIRLIVREDLHVRVVGDEVRVVAAVGRVERQHHQEGVRLLLHVDALRLHRLRQLRHRLAHAVLHVHLRQLGVGVDREVDGQRVVAGRRAGRRHVDHVVRAVDLLLDRRADVLRDQRARWRRDRSRSPGSGSA